EFSIQITNFYYVVIPTQRRTKMPYDDPRVEWIKNSVCVMFDLPDSGSFEELLSRGDGEEEQKIIHFLNVVTGEEAPSVLFFFKNIREEEVEVEIPVENDSERTPSVLSEVSLISNREITPADQNRNGQNRQSQDSSNVEDSQSQDPAVEGLSEATKGNKPPPNIEVQVVYHVELHVDVNNIPQRNYH
ncbi:hypothetical protein cypCar_00048552, partial [Cyprinus carpio]